MQPTYVIAASAKQSSLPAMTNYRYRAFGLDVVSDIPLPDLQQTSGVISPDVTISAAPVPVTDSAEPIGLHVTPDGAILNIPEAGRYLVSDGNSIIVEPSPAATDRNVRLYLLGSAFGAILHQRGLLPLHANIIDFGGAAVAFMGHSGAGKSTLATWFHDRGHVILGDDVCVVRPDESGKPVAEPGLLRIRLWGDALEASGRTATDYDMSFDDMDKYDVPLSAGAPLKPLRLAAIYNLHSVDPASESSIERLTGVGAIQALVANTYRGSFVAMLDGVGHHLAQCIALARQVPVFDLRRRWSLDALADEVAYIEAHVRTVLDQQR